MKKLTKQQKKIIFNKVKDRQRKGVKKNGNSKSLQCIF